MNPDSPKEFPLTEENMAFFGVNFENRLAEAASGGWMVHISEPPVFLVVLRSESMWVFW